VLAFDAVVIDVTVDCAAGGPTAFMFGHLGVDQDYARLPQPNVGHGKGTVKHRNRTFHVETEAIEL